MSFNLRKATPNDMPRVLELIQELAVYEKEPEAVIITAEDLTRDGFGENPLFNCVVAEMDGKIRGMALFYFRYSTWKGKTVHLEDLIVQEDFRGKGLGKALYQEVMKFAKMQQVKRVEWVVLDWNTSAADFYESTGANVMRDWNTVQFDEQARNRFLNQ